MLKANVITKVEIAIHASPAPSVSLDALAAELMAAGHAILEVDTINNRVLLVHKIERT